MGNNSTPSIGDKGQKSIKNSTYLRPTTVYEDVVSYISILKKKKSNNYTI